MATNQLLREVFDLTDSTKNVIFNMTLEEARRRVASGNPDRIRKIDGHFALVAREGDRIRLARSLQIPMRFFIAKRENGPVLVVSDRIDRIKEWLDSHGLGDQFHASYTRMVPAHYVTEIALIGCPDPNPTYKRFFSPQRESLPTDHDEIGRRYIGAVAGEIDHWLAQVPADAPIGVAFSGGIDSGAVFCVLYDAILRAGLNPARLKAFTLSVEGKGDDLGQSREFLGQLNLQLFHDVIEVPRDYLDLNGTVRVLEDYKPLDIQAGSMMLALCRGIRTRYRDWEYLVDGDGGDENLKDYPIEENPELTIRSVLSNPMLYHEGWGVDSIKHSLTYSGGLSRGCTRSYGPASHFGFQLFSPFMLPNVVEVAEGIPFVKLTQWDHNRLYALKGRIVSRGVEAVTGLKMPVFDKRRFQHGALSRGDMEAALSEDPAVFRRAFQAVFDG